MRTIPSPHYERSTLFESDLDKYEAERSLYRNLLRAETAIKEGARKRREHCNPIKEMSVYAPDDDNEARAKSEWDALIIVGAFALVAVLLAGAVMWLSYIYADPILAVLGRVLN